MTTFVMMLENPAFGAFHFCYVFRLVCHANHTHTFKTNLFLHNIIIIMDIKQNQTYIG